MNLASARALIWSAVAARSGDSALGDLSDTLKRLERPLASKAPSPPDKSGFAGALQITLQLAGIQK